MLSIPGLIRTSEYKKSEPVNAINHDTFGIASLYNRERKGLLHSERLDLDRIHLFTHHKCYWISTNGCG